jgi:pimeloyl-ACP methyl ester carboxylesterase
VSLGVHVTGDGPVDLVVMMGWLSHLELSYAHPTLANFLRRLSRRHRVILFDKRGTGLSDRVGDPTSFSQHLEDMRVVMDAADSERAVFLGIGEAAAVATLFAAVHPERTLGVIAFGGSARPTRDPSTLDAVADTIRSRWGEPLFADVVAPSLVGDTTFTDWQGTYLRTAGSPANAIALLKANASLDIRKIAPAVGAPMLVVHRKGDRLVPVERGRELASLVLRSELVELEGDDHLPFVGDVTRSIAAIESFTGVLAKEAGSGERVVGHPVAAIVALARVVDAEVAGRAAVATGRLVGLEAEDAVYAFDSIDHAVAFARAAVRDKHAARAGVHVGPCAARSPSLTTPAVLEARRLAAKAKEGEVAVSDTLRDLAFGVDLAS